MYKVQVLGLCVARWCGTSCLRSKLVIRFSIADLTREQYPNKTNYFWGTASSALAPRLDQGQQSNRLVTPRGIASVKIMRIPCSGRKITIGRASIVWPGTRRKSYFLSRTLRIMRICSMA